MMKINFKNKLLMTVASISLVGSAYSITDNSQLECSDLSHSLSMSQFHVVEPLKNGLEFAGNTCEMEDLSYSRVFSNVKEVLQNEIVQRDRKQVVLPAQNIQEPLAQRLFHDTVKMDQLEALPQALEYLRNLKVDDTLIQQLSRGLDSKIAAVNKARQAFEPSLTDSLMSSFLGTRMDGKVTQLKEDLDKALGTLKIEFESIYGSLTSNSEIDTTLYLESVLEFLNLKKGEIRLNNEQSLLKYAAEVQFIQKLGMTDYTIETVLTRSNASEKEFSGVVLFNKQTAQAIVVMADGTASTFADLSQGSVQEETNLGMQGKADHFNRYASVDSQIHTTFDRLIADAKNDQRTLDVITIGENNGAADALQAAFHIKKTHGDAVQVGVVGFDAGAVYKGTSAEKVQAVLGKENIVFSRQKSWISGAFDYLMGYEAIGMDVTSVANAQKSAPQPELPVAEEPGFLSKAWSALTSWF